MKKEIPYDRSKIITSAFKAGLNGDQIDAMLADYEQQFSETIYPAGIIGFTEKGASGRSMWPLEDTHNYQDWVRVHLKLGHVIRVVKNGEGEVFAIGDEVNYKTEYGGLRNVIVWKIDHFFIRDDNIILARSQNCHNVEDINTIVRPVKKTLTEDSFEINNGDFLFCVENFEIIQRNIDPKKLIHHPNIKIFKEKSNVEKYVEDNKPIYSKKEIRDAIGSLEKVNYNEESATTSWGVNVDKLTSKLNL